MQTISAEGYYYALAYALAADLYLWVNPRRYGNRRTFLLEVLMTGAITVLARATDLDRAALFFPTLALILGAVYVMLWIIGSMSPLNTLYYGIRAYVLGEFSASAAGQVSYYIGQNTSWGAGTAASAIVLILVLAAICLCMWPLERRYTDRNALLEIRPGQIVSVLIIALSIVFLSNLSNLSPDTLFSSGVLSDIMAIRTLMDLVGVMILYAYHAQLHEARDRVENEMLRQMMAAQYANYQISRQSVELVHHKYHDLKHQLILLRSESGGARREEILDRMEGELRSYEAQIETGNDVLDTILTARSLQCLQNGIVFTCVADGRCIDGMDTMDAAALFGNVLDNAVEAVEKIDNAEDRQIHVTAVVRRHFSVITVGNTCAEPVQFQNGLPKTTKKDTDYHGYGVRSMCAIVHRRGGDITFSYTDHWFEVKITMPL